MIVVTGGAGFIGSACVWGLNQKGRDDIVIVDDLQVDSRRNQSADLTRKERNLGGLKYERLVGVDDFRRQLTSGAWNKTEVEGLIHVGACSYTTESDWQYLLDNNVAYTKEIIDWCVRRGIRCLYASSGAVYGNGSQGFSDDHGLFERLRPLNLYGQSKLAVDIWAHEKGYLNEVVGLRYFNVFGPNEWHKGKQRSVIAKKFFEIQRRGVIELFKSERPDYADGEQVRDFLYINDAVATTLFLLERWDLHGVFNVGTGSVRTWNDVAYAMFVALDLKPKIKYVALPSELKDKYQYRTQADISKLLAAGHQADFMALEPAVQEYILDYLLPDRHLGET